VLTRFEVDLYAESEFVINVKTQVFKKFNASKRVKICSSVSAAVFEKNDISLRTT